MANALLKVWNEVEDLMSKTDYAFPGLSKHIRRTTSSIEFIASVAPDITHNCDFNTEVELISGMNWLTEKVGLMNTRIR